MPKGNKKNTTISISAAFLTCLGISGAVASGASNVLPDKVKIGALVIFGLTTIAGCALFAYSGHLNGYFKQQADNDKKQNKTRLTK